MPNYLIETDGLGEYRAINGSTDEVTLRGRDATSLFTSVIPNTVLALPLDVADKEEELLSNVYAYDISIETDNNGNYTAKDADGTVIDTSTDATSIFTNMSYAASLIESGGTIYVKAGTYTGLSSVQLHSDVTWVGDGDSTVLKLMDNAPTGIYTLANIKSSVFLGLEVENVIIKNIKFDGNKAENTISFQDHDHETLLLCDSENILITNVTAVNSAKTGIHIRNCVNVQVENCLIDGSATFGFAASSWYDGLCTNVNIRHSRVKNSGWNHISFQRIHTTTGDIYGCGAYNNYMEGDCGDIALDTWGNNENYLVHNIYFVNNTVNGMSGIGSSGIEAHFGLRLETAEQCYAIGNTLLNVNRGIMDDPWGNGNHIIVCNTVKLKDTATIIPMGIELYGNNNYIDNNDVTSAPTGYSVGIIFGGGSNVVSCNVFHELDKELWAFVGVQTEYGTGNNIIELNDFSDTNSIEIFLESDIVRNNVDYSSSDDGQSNLPRRLFIASDGDSGVEGISSTVVETKEGDSEQFIFSVKEGYELLHVYVDGVDVIDTFPSKYTFSNLNQHHVIIGESVLSAGGLPENIVFDYSGNDNQVVTKKFDISIETDNNGNYTAKDADGTVIDTSTDATSIFTNMSYAASLIESGGTIYVKAGTYTGLSSVQLHSDVTWVGDGDSTILKLMDNAPQDTFIETNIKSCVLLGVEIENLVIKNLKLDGNTIGNTAELEADAHHNHCALRIVNSENCTIKNVTAINAKFAGMYFKNSINCQIEDCVINDSGLYGFVASSWDTGTCTNINIRRCTVKNSGWNHISFMRLGTGDIYECGAYNNYMEGDCGDIALDTWGNNENYLVHDIYFMNNTVNGMSGIGSSDIEAHFGLRLEKAEQCYAIGNTLLNVNRGIMDDPWGNGNHIIIGNTIYLKDSVNFRPMGMELHKPNNLIENNSIYSCSNVRSDGVLVGGSGNIIRGNKFYQLSPIHYFSAVNTFYSEGYNLIEHNDFTNCWVVRNTVYATQTCTFINNIGLS